MGVPSKRQEGLLRAVADEEGPSAPRPTQARNAITAMCRLVSPLKGSSRLPSSVSEILLNSMSLTGDFAGSAIVAKGDVNELARGHENAVHECHTLFPPWMLCHFSARIAGGRVGAAILNRRGPLRLRPSCGTTPPHLRGAAGRCCG
jgi:hypothetical protein